jgi:hypothetical protein
LLSAKSSLESELSRFGNPLCQHGNSHGLESNKDLSDFRSCLKKAGISKRKGYYLLVIDRVYPPLKIPRERLIAIGWTKLGFLAKYTDEEQLELMLEAAESQTVEELKAFLAGRDPPTDVVTLRFTSQQYGIFAGLLLSNGAYLLTGGGLANKEMALMKVASVVGKATGPALPERSALVADLRLRHGNVLAPLICRERGH